MYQNSYSENDPMYYQSENQIPQFQQNQNNIYTPYEQNQYEFSNAKHSL